MSDNTIHRFEYIVYLSDLLIISIILLLIIPFLLALSQAEAIIGCYYSIIPSLVSNFTLDSARDDIYFILYSKSIQPTL